MNRTDRFLERGNEVAMSITCSACGSTDVADLAVVLAGGDRSFVGGPLRLLIYCHRRCLAHPELTAPCAQHIDLALVTEDLLLGWYRAGRTTSAPDAVSLMTFGELRPEFIKQAETAMSERLSGAEL